MSPTEIDWTFDSIPADGEDSAGSLRPPAPGRPAPPPAGRRARPRGWVLALLGLAAVAGLGLYLVYQAGWRRVQVQLGQEVAYEDSQSLARNTGAVAALQWPDQAWIGLRTAEAALGWPARPPAEDLLPTGDPARVVAVDSAATGEVEATVVRRFADSAGRTFDFEYVQRYRSVAPGVWQRLAPDPAALQTTLLWAGQRLTATLPAADEPWLSPLLPQMDAYLVRACADWQCPADLLVPVTFSGRLEELPSLAPARRPDPGAQGPQPYPVTFDLVFRTPRYPRRVILPSLQLAGRPHDQAAQAALVRSTTVNLLAYVATELAQSSRSGSGDYLDALIARAEIRLGLSPAPAWRPSPAAYLPPEALWPFSRIGETRARRADLAARLQALAFLDFALADRPPSAEGTLLRRIRFHPRLDTWLSDNLMVDGPALVERWAAQTTAAFAALAPPHWDELEGLAYVCQSGAWLVRGGQPTPLPSTGPRTWLLRHALSADGQYLAVVEATSSTVSQIRVINLSDQSSQVVASAGLGLPLGWTPAGDLLYLTQADGPFSSMFAYELRLYDPRTQLNLALSADPLVTPWDYRPTWSADHTLMAVTLVQNAAEDSEVLVTAPGVVSFKTPIQALRLAAYGYAAAIAPDGRLLAYVDGPLSREGLSGQAGEIKLVSPLTQAVYPLAASGPTDFYDVSALHWSPDSRQLAFQARAANGRASLYRVTWPDGNPAQAELQRLDSDTEAFELSGFSADGRYLAAQHYEQSRTETLVFDLATGQSTHYLGGGSAMPWSPHGHWLALAGPGGLYVADPATGEVQWVTRGQCTPSWFELP